MRHVQMREALAKQMGSASEEATTRAPAHGGGSTETAPQITVVIPAFNAERFLDETLSSVTAQTFRSIEIIVVDDGSTDSTPAIVRRWMDRDARVRSVRTENRGVAHARNLGLELASAKFVAFVDADDLWHPTKLRAQIDMLDSGCPDSAACYALYRSIDTDGRVLRDTPVLTCSGYIYARHLLCHLVGNGSSLLVRRDAALAVGGFDPSYASEGIGGAEDLDFELRLAAQYKIAAVPLFLVGYRRYEGNMSSDRRRMVKAMARTVEKTLETGPALPRAVRRGALVAVLEYSLTAHLVRRDFRRAIQTLVRLFLVNPRSTFRIFNWLPKTARKMLAHRLGWHSTQVHEEHAPYFGQLEPVNGIDKAPPPYLARRVRAARAVDEALWRRVKRETTDELAPCHARRWS